jgi:osmotically-inducible protein OsmY
MRSTCIALAAAVLAVAGPPPAAAQLEWLVSPKTLIDRAVEARSAGDIARDNAIVLRVNGLMAKIASIRASTEIYEQRLLVTGLFDDRNDYEAFRKGVEGIEGVKALYWHAVHLSEEERESRRILGWADTLVLATKARARLLGTAGVADVNFRVAADVFGTVYVLGRARSEEERRKALARAKDGDGVRKVMDYVEVRP